MSEKLRDAIKNNDSKLVQQLIARGENVNAPIKSKYGKTALAEACYYLNIEIAKILLEVGADVNAVYEKHKTALTQACDAYQKPRETVAALVKLLLDNGAKVDLVKDGVDGPLHYACMYGYPEAVDLLIEAGVDVNQKGAYGRTPLIYAACSSFALPMLDSLLKAGADIHAKNDGKENALFEIITKGDEGELVVQFLIQKGIDLYDSNNYEDSSLHWAAFCERRKIVEVLLEAGMDVNLNNKRGETALQKAMSRQNLDLVKDLYERGADISLKSYYTTVLAFAVEKKDKAFVSKLLKQLGTASKGQGALEKAAEKGALDLAEILIKAGIPVDDRVSETSDTPLMRAAYYGQEKMITFLLEQGADYNLYNYQKNTALLHAAWKGKGVAILLDAGADINQQNNKNWNALMQACYQKHLELVKLLLERGSSTDMVDREYGATALVIAQDVGATEIVKLLKSYNATTRSIKKEKCTILECDICAYIDDKKEILPKEDFIKLLHLQVIEGTETKSSTDLASCVYADDKQTLYECPNCNTVYYNSFSSVTEEFHIIRTTITNTLLRVNMHRSRDLLVHWNKTEELAVFDKNYPTLIQLFQTKITQEGATINPKYLRFVLEAVMDYYLENNNWEILENNLLKNKEPIIVFKTIENWVLMYKWRYQDAGIYPITSEDKILTPKRYEQYKPFLEKYLKHILAYLDSYKNHEDATVKAQYEATNKTVEWTMRKKKQ